MFDERHLQLSSAYAHSSEYFIRNVIYPLAKYIDEYIKQKVEASINKRLYWEQGKQTYAMSRDENGGWKWEKYDPKANQFVSPPVSVQKQAASSLAEAVSQYARIPRSEIVVEDTTQYTEDSITQPIKAQTEKINYFAKSLGLKIKADHQTFVANVKSNGKIGFSLIDDKINKIIPDNRFAVEIQADVNKYLAESFTALNINIKALNRIEENFVYQLDKEINNYLKDCLTSFLSPIEASNVKKDNQNNQLNSQAQDIPSAPAHIDTQHWQELVGKSGIAPGIAEMNFKSLHIDPIEQEHLAWEHLLYSNNIKRLNTGQLSKGWRDAYSHIEAGGWWCKSGVDPAQFEQLAPATQSSWKAWGCYKPNQPRPKTENKDGKSVVIPGKFTKYEHPPGVEKSIFLLDVPDDIAQGIYQKAQVNPTDSDRKSSFWYCVWKHNIPVSITEGAKKAASLLSQGDAAIGLAGINGGYYKTKKLENPVENKINTKESEQGATLAAIESDETKAIDDNEIEVLENQAPDDEIDNKSAKSNATHFLHPELAVFATTGREFKICFDFDSSIKTKNNVDAATLRTGQLLEEAGCKVSVISLPGPDKGVDDYIVAQGSEAFALLQSQALPLEQWDDLRHLESRSTIKLKDGTTKKVGDKNQAAAIAQEIVSPDNESQQENLIAQTPSSSVNQPAQENKSPDESSKALASELNISLCNLQVKTSSSSAKSSQLQQQPSSANQRTSFASNARQQHNDTVAPVSTDNKQSPPLDTTTQNQSASQNQQPTNTTTQLSTQQTEINAGSSSWFPWKRKKPINETPPLKPIPNWAKTQDVTLYQRNYRRRQLEDTENQAMAQAAVALVKKYGVETKDNQLTYQADAFIINKKGEDYTIYRRHDNKPLMTFMADRWSQVRRVNLAQDFNTKNYPINILPVERQEFLLIADYLKSGKQLPSVDDDPRKIASVLSSVSPSGTHNILESFKQPQVLQVMMGAIRNFEKDDLTLDNYRILFQQGAGGKSTLQLFKTELGGLQREAVRFEFERTETGMTHQVKALAITEADLEKLGLLSQKLHINYKTLFGNPTDTRNIDLPVHPEITRNLDEEQSHQSTQSTPNVTDRKTQSNPQEASFNFPKQQNAVSHSTTPTPNSTTPSQPNFSSNLDKVLLPLHPVLKQYWEQLEKDGSSHETVVQGHLEFQSKIQQTGKLTVGEQRELYQQIQNQAWSEINHFRRTDIVLPPLAHIVNDLRSQAFQEPQPQFSSEEKRDTLVPLHPDIASHWHGLETNKTWSSVANQYNNPLREKLSKTGKLTIGEQRELYQKIFLQSQFEQQNIGQTNISLPPLNDVIQDLLNTRSQVINNTYTPKVEVHSQKSRTPQQPTTTNSQELEL
ncbi:DUF3854 domain-containing protein [Nostoc punctiforme]|uniref:DUF3854 domain-containing protein n=1 Tax=Nostoc punctiforme (strain ATCC 29133 / PCC 73102) TaxID=63737 RepID=B2JBL8_NOSP7|nr:DUF3854 domain-containing protein [Nostoc punctiforme]ACC85322.1 conserved hypothetical protein [Nostoc punctiforme PCC 73102]